MQALRQTTLGILIGLLGAALILLIASPPHGKAITLLPTPTPAPILVHVNGQVAHPGLFSLAPGSRVDDALTTAGGVLPDAALDTINLAQPLFDGQQIHVPKQDEIPQKSETLSTLTSPIDINTATLEQLDQLPGIGPSKAQDIITYRQNNGAFDTIEQIMDVPGIGPVLFEKIKGLIYVTSSN